MDPGTPLQTEISRVAKDALLSAPGPGLTEQADDAMQFLVKREAGQESRSVYAAFATLVAIGVLIFCAAYFR